MWIHIGVWVWVGFNGESGWRGFGNHGEQIYSLMVCSHKLNYILVAVQYEGNLKWLFSTRNRSKITNIISSEIIELLWKISPCRRQSEGDMTSSLHITALQSLYWQRLSTGCCFQIHKCYFTDLRENQKRSSCHLTTLRYCSWHYHCQESRNTAELMIMKATADEMFLKMTCNKKNQH